MSVEELYTIRTTSPRNTINMGIAGGAVNIKGNLRVANNTTISGNLSANYLRGDGYQLTNLNVSAVSGISNGTSNVRIVANSNIAMSVAGNANVFTVTGTGANISGTANITGNVITSSKYIKSTTSGISGGAQGNITRYPSLTSTSNADIHIGSTVTGNATVSKNYGITFAQGSYGTTGAIMFSENNSDGTAIGFYVSNNYGAASQLKVSIEPSGTILPGSNVAQNLGSTTLRWSTVYTGDLELSNGIGDYTIVEGEDDLFLYNNRSGKTYRFMLQEVDPAIVPPKKGT